MRPIPFPEQIAVIAEGQPMSDAMPDGPTFLGLPAYYTNDETISLWRLSWWERIVVLCTGQFWHRQLNWGGPIQAVSMQTDSPFIKMSTQTVLDAVEETIG